MIELVLLSLPNGVLRYGRLALSIVVSPRLTGGTRLGDYPAMLKWLPDLLRERPRILLDFDGTEVEASFDPGPLRLDVWSELFDADTPVEPFVFDDMRDRLVISYPTRAALAAVRGVYQTLTQGTDGAAPMVSQTARALAPLVLDGDVDAVNARTREALFHSAQGLSRSGAAPVAAYSLYSRMPQPGPDAPDPLPRTEAELAGLIDFHKALTAIAAHPGLMRALGLVLDVSVPAEKVPAGAPGGSAGLVSVRRLGMPAMERAARLTTPAVRYRHRPASLGDPAFHAADGSPDGPIREGWLGLPEQGFQLIDLDIESAFGKLVRLATMSTRMGASPFASGALPALRSGGISLAAHERGVATVAALRRAAQVNDAFAAGEGALSASDLTRGYRLDVWSDRRGGWHSLHRRRGRYTFGEAGRVTLDVAEEGFAQFAAVSPAPDPTRAEPIPDRPIETDLYVDEAIARWAGWSLSAPRPGRAIHRSEPHDPLKSDETTDAFATAFHMRTHFAPEPRSLPSLRFGDRYRMRVRAVDLAGNSPDPTADAPADYPATLPAGPDAQPYFRYEPVPSPLLILHSVPEATRPALDRLVIRSFNSDPGRDTLPTDASDDRHVTPPRAAVELLERHGMLDAADGRTKGDPVTFAELAARDDAAFPTMPIGDPPQDAPIVAADALIVDYSPDPLSRGAAFRALPGVARGTVLFAGQAGLEALAEQPDGDPDAGPVLQVGFGADWPNRLPFRLALAEGEGPPDWNPATRVLTVRLPKGTTATSRLSSVLSDNDLGLLGVWAWQRDALDEEARSIMAGAGVGAGDALARVTRRAGRLLRLALEGGQWALTPSIPVEFIHATQQPLGLPVLVAPGPQLYSELGHAAGADDGTGVPQGALVALRQLGDTEAALIGGLDLHLASTGRIDIAARWTDIADVPGTAQDVLTDASAALDPLTPGIEPGPVRAPGADPRWNADVTEAGGLAFVPDFGAAGHRAPIHRFGDTRHRVVRYAATATSRFVTDFPADAGLVFSRTGPEVSVSVPSSAPPPAPAIVAALPSFGWTRARAGTLATSIRSGQGIRLWLARDWFASGAGELLGVVLWSKPKPPSDEDRRDRYAGKVTEWGLDPIRDGGRLGAMPAIRNFRGYALSRTNVPCAELGLADVVGYETSIDVERDLRFADIELAADLAYMPFLRLALVRFQPEALRRAEISPIVAADILQLQPDRSAMLIADPTLPNLYRLTVSGVGPKAGEATPWRNRIDVKLERRLDTMASDLAWAPVEAGAATITDVTPGASAPAVLYSGLIEFAAPPPAGRFRLVIREFEIWDIDPPTFSWITVAGKLRGTTSRFTAERVAAPTDPAVPAVPVLKGGVARRSSGSRLGTAVSSTARAVGNFANTGRGKGRRLVYAEFMAIDPPAGIATGAGDGPIGTGPGTATDSGGDDFGSE